MKNDQAAADDGLVAEMLKAGNKKLIKAMASIFSDLLCNRAAPPNAWKTSRLSVVLKTGDCYMPKNYKPISITPVMAKLYSTVLLARLEGIIESTQIDTQFGNRKGRGCSDAVHVLRIVAEKSAEWRETLWYAAVDVEKAFDRLHHLQILDALRNEDVDSDLVAAIQSMYVGLRGYVQLWRGSSSREFSVGRGVRQGDPLSPILLGLVMKNVLKKLDCRWQGQGFGTNVGQDAVSQSRLTHIEFVDDVTVIARSWSSMRQMFLDLRGELAKYGLSLHPTKCNAQTNIENWDCRGIVELGDGLSVDVVAEGTGLKILGTQVFLRTGSTEELQSRIAAGWSSLYAMKDLLLNAKISVRKRLKLLDTSVGSTVLWCTESWALKVDDKLTLKSAQNSMLRRVVGVRRFENEDYIEWITRATRTARRLARSAGVRCWQEAHADRKWRWAGHVARLGLHEWAWRVTTWRDENWQALQPNHSRPLRARPGRWTRWQDSVHCFAKLHSARSWLDQAADREGWKAHALSFAGWLAR
jgi:hypothetical protein